MKSPIIGNQEVVSVYFRILEAKEVYKEGEAMKSKKQATKRRENKRWHS